ncbi:S66 family peptidase [Veronia pacifica]|uniref:Microcin C7 resistance protein MccF n=1 Tax=Veronia pacifica TaxID=1080227 RepID=A0A1C3EMK1_9GAMM|nr:S66 peptidase family protein [Veronia pacifica]ODA34460.1 microcin C7 resistance protein MccF [Veronia pacifica]
MIKPKALQRGDAIAVICPSWGGATAFPHIYQSGINNLRELGFKVVEFPTTKMSQEEVYNSPQARADDINRAFADPEIKAIVATIGGSDSVRILKYLDTDVIKKNPKIVMGYSDFTTVAIYLNKLGLVTFLGPSVMAGFSQFHNFSSQYQQYVADVLAGHNIIRPWPVFPAYSDGYGGYPDWGDEANTGKLNPLQENIGPRFLQGSGKVKGKLFGGNLEVLEMTKGTPFWPSPDFWQGRVLAIETSEEKPSVDYVRYCLRNYGAMGALENVSGLLFGRAAGYSDEEKRSLEETILSVVRDEFGLYDLAIICNLDFGHTDPQLILALGAEIEIDCDNECIRQTESPFSE